jgi:hypothetical protein
LPRLDGTGPNGQGPITGCCLGTCVVKLSSTPPHIAANDIPFYHKYQRFSLSQRRRYGVRRGRRRCWYGSQPMHGPYGRDAQKSLLEESEYLQEQVDRINARLSEIRETLDEIRNVKKKDEDEDKE